MRLKKKRKPVRMRGTRTHGWAMKKHKGKGNHGGKGMAGAGKRAKQKKTYVIRYHYPYFGRQGFTSRKTAERKVKVMNVGEIAKQLNSFEKKGIAKKTKEGIVIDLKEYKILGEGEIKEKLIINAKSASNSAKEKIEKSGGKIVVEEAEREIKEGSKKK
ncbi:MAG: uL15m family ribosomal protein [Nanoarchaeota archaeon]